MNETGIMQEIRNLEQKIQESTERVAELSNKITEHGVGFSFNAVGQTDAIYEYEIDRENMIQQQMMLKQKLASLYNQVQIR